MEGNTYLSIKPETAAAQDGLTPIMVWSTIGIAFLALNIYVFGAWILGPYFHPVPAGPDLPPLWMKLSADFIECFTIVIFALTAYHYIYKSWRQTGALSSDALMVLALITLYWQNTLPNYFSVGTLLSSAFINDGSWYPYIPGWVSPNIHNLPEAPIAWGLCYACWFVFFPMKYGAKFMVWLRRRYPSLGPIQVFLIAYVIYMGVDFMFEAPFLRTGMYAYAGAVQKWSLWGGSTYQFPIYEIFGWGFSLTLFACLYLSRDGENLTFVERGVERLRIGKAPKTFLRFAALVAAFNIFFLADNTLMMVAGLHGDAFPKGYPSYLINGICGPGTNYDCPRPDLPVARITTPTNH